MYSFCGDYRLSHTVKWIVLTTVIFIQNKSIDFHEIGNTSSCDSNKHNRLAFNYIYLISAERIPCKSYHTSPQYVSNLCFPLVSLRTITASSEIPRHGAVNLSLPHKESASSNPESSREGWNKTHTKAQPVRPDKMYWKWRKTAALRPLKDLRLNCYVRAALNKRAAPAPAPAPAPAAAAATTVDGGGGGGGDGDGPVAINVAAAGATLATKWKPFTSSQSCEQKRKNSFIQSFIHSCIQHCCTHHLSLSLSLTLVGSQLVRLVFYVVTTCRRVVLWGGSRRDLSGFVLPF